MKIVQRLKIKHAQGLHARPATLIVRLLQSSNSKVHFTHRKETVNAKSIMSILMLAVHQNAWITITIEGDDAETTLQRLIAVFDSDFAV